MSVFMPQPPLPALVSHVGTLLLTCNSQAYCRAPLLADPLSRVRLGGLARLLELAALPLAAVQPVLWVSPRVLLQDKGASRKGP